MITRRSALSVLLAGASGARAASTPFRAGTARVRITPQESIWMGGYAARTHPSTGVAHDLWAKALALEDAFGGRFVIVTMDLLRVPTTAIAQRVEQRYRLPRRQLLLNCSHNHSGPAPWEGDPFPALSAEEYEKCRHYTETLTSGLIELVGAALRDLAPASMASGTARATFGANRRTRTGKAYEIAYNPSGPADPRVPVLRVSGSDGTIRTVLFGYACHNTTVTGSTYQVNADFAGYAQSALESTHPGANAMFLQLCAGDQDPYPRGSLELAQQHGNELAAAVDSVLNSKLRKVAPGRIRSAFETVPLEFAAHTRETFEHRLNDPSPAVVRNARAMLRAYDQGHPIRSLDYPVQALRIGTAWTLVALGGEPVIDYALRAQREFPEVVLAGYSNQVKGYVPSRRVLEEGGYEGGDSMIYYGLPGPFAPAVEETIFSGIRKVLHQL